MLLDETDMLGCEREVAGTLKLSLSVAMLVDGTETLGREPDNDDKLMLVLGIDNVTL